MYEAMAKVPGAPGSAAERAGEAKAFQSVLHMSEGQFMKGMATWIRQVFRPAG
jgi:hypothetical protein